ncbi:MAG: hypothetical protein KJO80_07425 [Gammaproteobacteria bacterium]|nr:hypothetical protein [Gammaproteobacteria bacterium]
MKKVFLHIGIGKTGTTAIQKTLAINSNLLAANRVSYPVSGDSGFNHHVLAPIQFNSKTLERVRSDLIKIAENYEKSRFSTLVLSSERLCYAKDALVSVYRDVFANFDTNILLYVRRQESLIESAFMEWVKTGWDHKGSIEKYYEFESKGFDFQRRLINWERHFHRSKISVHLYDRKIHPDACAHFFSLLGISDTFNQVELKSANPSLLPELLQLVISIDKLNLSEMERSGIVRQIMEISSKLRPHSNEKLLKPSLAGLIRERYRESNEYVARRYMNPADGDAFLNES